MRKHFDGKKASHQRDDFQNHYRQHKKLSSHRGEKNWKNHLLDEDCKEPLDEDFFHFDEEDDE